MSRFVLLLLAFFLTAPALAAQDDATLRQNPFYENITDTAKTVRGRELLDFLDSSVMQDAAKLPVAALWLRENSIDVADPEKMNALYFLAYSDMLLVLAEGERGVGQPEKYRSLYQTAMLNFHIFEIVANVDGARCQDPTALQAVRAMVSSRLENVTTAYKLFDRKTLDEIEKSAIREEDKNVTRPPNTDICSMGQARLIDLSKQKGVIQKTVNDPRFPGGKRKVYVQPAGYVFYPAIVPDSEWLETRNTVLGDVTQEWAKRYAAATR